MTESSSMFSLERWDLAPGEAFSQSPPIRAVHGAPLCPAPTLDSAEFVGHNSFNEDCSESLDSLAEFGLAPGEVRSQSPYRVFDGSQPPRCPPPTLDTQEFENGIESGDVWIVEDSLAGWDVAPGGSQGRSQRPDLDLRYDGNLSVESQEFENNRVISDDVWLVEDSLACWDSAPGDGRQEAPNKNYSNDLKSQGFPPPLNVPGRSPGESEHEVVPPSNHTPVNWVFEAGIGSKFGSNLAGPLSSSAGKRSLSPCSPQGDKGKFKKQVKLDPGSNSPHELNSLHFPAPSSERSICGAATESSREHNLRFPKLENFSPVPSSPPKHSLPTMIPPPISDIKPAATTFQNVLCKTSPVRRFGLIDITNSKVSETRPSKALSSEKGARGSPAKESSDSGSNLCLGGTFPTCRDNFLDNHEVLTSPEKIGRRAQPKAKVQSSLGFQVVTSRKLGQGTEGWLFPRAGKIFGPTLRQPSLDRFIR